MYTNHVNIQIIISLLKQHNIKHLVLSPGTRNAPLVHSVETDSFFTCYSIVDERSAAYFALGLSASIDAPVCLSCTSSTAACNYLPAIKEAYEKHIQLIALTADRDRHLLYQMEDQMIDQVNMYKGYTKCSVNLPAVKCDDDIWFCERSINKVILELDHHGKGPVHINFEVSKIGNFSTKQLPVYRKITRVESFADARMLKNYQEKLACKKRILVLCGEYYSQSDELEKLLKEFAQKYNAVISYDYFSNITNDAFLKTVMITEAMDAEEFKKFLPDLVITIGSHVWSFIKYKLRHNGRMFEHWRISSDGEVIDGFKALTNVFECPPEAFFKAMNQVESSNNDNQYYQLWKNRINSVCYPDLKFTNFSVVRDFIKQIPDGSLLHLSILNSTRLINFWSLGSNVRCFSNLGADGIDGSISTFLGQSNVNDKLSFLVIGDLSFLYDLNATLIQLHENQRILLINNFAGGEFHTNFGLDSISTLNQHIAAGHHTKLAAWISMLNVKYLCASNQQELNESLKVFVSKSEVPIILEVFTDADTDAKTLKKFYSINRTHTNKTFVKKFIYKALRVLKLKRKI